MNVMKEAWRIAREAVGKWGGKAREYFAASLKEAWFEVKLEVLKAKRKKHAMRFNEGGYGYNPFDEKINELVAKRKAEFEQHLLENGEYFRLKWRAAVMKYSDGEKFRMTDMKKIEAEAGITHLEAMWLKGKMTKSA